MLRKIQTRLISLALILSTVVAAVLTIAPSGMQAETNPNPGIIPVNAQYKKLAAEWWQWALSYPVSENPLFDETGAASCLGDQDGVTFSFSEASTTCQARPPAR